MLRSRLVAWTLATGVAAIGAGPVSGQNFPGKPIRLVAPEAGGGADLVARLIAQGISGPLGQQVVVENRGGSVAVPAEVVAKAPPDGHVLLLFGSTIWLMPFLQDNLPYDPVKDFSPITLATTSPNILVVHPSVAAKNVKELIALAKAKPGTINYASGITGSITHLSGELFIAIADVKIVRIPYKGVGTALTALMGNQVQLMFASSAGTMSHVNAGRLRALAVTSAQPSALFPGLPTIASAGLPGYEAATIYGMFAPAATPAPIISRLNQESTRVLSSADVKEKLFNTGIESVASTPEQFTATLKSEMARMGKVIRDAGIRVE